MAIRRTVREEVKPALCRWIRLSQKHKGKNKGFFEGSGREDKIKGVDYREWCEYEFLFIYKYSYYQTAVLNIYKTEVNWAVELELSTWQSVIYNDDIWSYKAWMILLRGNILLFFNIYYLKINLYLCWIPKR